MTKEQMEIHLRAGKFYGVESTCGAKVDYKSEETAVKKAEKLSDKYNHLMEGYPCFFCNGWHIGRAMTDKEIKQFS